MHQVAKYWSFSFSICPSNEYSGLIFFRIDWFDLLTVQVTLKSLLQHHSITAYSEASPMAQMVKNLPAMQETQVQSLGREDRPAKGMISHSSIPAWRISWTEEHGGLQSLGSQRVGHD